MCFFLGYSCPIAPWVMANRFALAARLTQQTSWNAAKPRCTTTSPHIPSSKSAVILTVSSSLRKMEWRRTNFFARTRAQMVIETVGFKEMVKTWRCVAYHENIFRCNICSLILKSSVAAWPKPLPGRVLLAPQQLQKWPKQMRRVCDWRGWLGHSACTAEGSSI